ncbi:MEDS domain-containing protein [Actinomadura parmotrematis]|uniref:MEDS domain-containing protein n=1 Tax=Actinomadura parmotrematis TaxID=2864039 RepID=A0ABS7FTV8_9ACTN|nr:MEDS domain-containing protein [Actinomadura parmotrematis]MBW8483842.1 MEDS domain-containing protein [Actinomadura parmotrematis]
MPPGIGDDARPAAPAGVPADAVAVGAMRFGDHLCLTYDNEDERRAILAAYIRDGLRASHKIIYLADEDDPAAVLNRLARAPGTAPAALAEAVRAGHLVVRPIIEAFLATGRFDPAETVNLLRTEIDVALVQGYDGVRITGETSFSLRGWPGTEDFGAFEHLCGEAIGAPGSRAMVICQYDRRWFDAAQLRELEGCHGAQVRVDDLHDDGVLRITPIFTPPGLRLTGALDESTLPAVRRALAASGARSGHFCLDLGDLEFCDLTGLGVLLGALPDGRAEGPAALPHRQIVLRGLPDYLALMMRIAGWESMPGVHLERAAP